MLRKLFNLVGLFCGLALIVRNPDNMAWIVFGVAIAVANFIILLGSK